jgi:CHASE2 domain-containing sensor protein
MNWQPLLRMLSRKTKAYWLFAAALIVAGMYFGTRFEEKGIWIDLRYRLYQGLERFNPRPPKAKRTVLVLVDDDDYWRGRLARRTPINRHYLADLLLALSECDPAVIAIDFNLRSPATDGSLKDNPEYTAETDDLRQSLNAVSAHRAVVLPATLDITPKSQYSVDGAIYDGLRLERGHLQIGYIQPPEDARLIPMARTLAGGGTIDSFAESIARAVNEEVVDQIGDKDTLPFGTFMPESEFHQVSASDVLRLEPSACQPLRHNIALVGAAWHTASYQRGDLVDLHSSPLGYISGVFLHANYIEAILDLRTYEPIGEENRLAIEFFFSALVAVLLAIEMGPIKKSTCVATVCLSVMLASYLFWQNLGIFFDFFFPVILLLAHAVIDYFRESYDALDARVKELEGRLSKYEPQVPET